MSEAAGAGASSDARGADASVDWVEISRLTASPVRDTSFRSFETDLRRVRAGWPHLAQYLLPSTSCDSDDKAVVALAKALAPPGTSAWGTVNAIRSFIRNHFIYVFHPLDDRASDTLRKREGMCTNKANLQVALLRAAGIPAGFCFVHITKAVYKGEPMLPQMYDMITDPTLHVFCAAFVPDEGRFMWVDATDREWGAPAIGGAGGEAAAAAAAEAVELPAGVNKVAHMENLPSGETIMERRFFLGPIGPVVAQIDSLVARARSPKYSTDDKRRLMEAQNAELRRYQALYPPPRVPWPDVALPAAAAGDETAAAPASAVAAAPAGAAAAGSAPATKA